ncbi:MAG: polyprenyl synthetase family protein [Chloroflexota bacterium]|jgi:geranylgeranyl pyrophosphate synthase
MSFRHIIDLVAALPEVSEWPELATTFEKAGAAPRPDWELPLIACESAGGKRADAHPLAAAVACLQLSIILVDDILDDDPRGAHVRYGTGPIANMALAYNNLALRLVDAAPYNERRKLAIASELGRVGLQTAVGQHLDVQNLAGQSNYWKVVAAKSTPFYGGALKVGAIAGGASETLAASVYDLGVLFGEIIQIEDDLTDALETPANADWQQERNNLLMLYALTTDHPQRQRFAQLKPNVQDQSVLHEAQQILVTSGAVAYCAYLLIHRYQSASKLLNSMNLPAPTPLVDLLDNYAESLLSLMQVAGIALSKEALQEPISDHSPVAGR